MSKGNLRGGMVILVTSWLPNPEIIRAMINRLLRTFENISQVELLKIC
jgi:hypothetical protein